MTERPILFSAPMVVALLAGRKTVTRRKPARWLSLVSAEDRLWVREAMHDKAGFRYAADDAPIDCSRAPDNFQTTRTSTMPSMFMPRWASRLTLIVAAKKYERLQEITHEEAEAEGVKCDMSMRGFRDHFAELWDRLHGAGSWDANPEVVAISFTVHKFNVDQMRSFLKDER